MSRLSPSVNDKREVGGDYSLSHTHLSLSLQLFSLSHPAHYEELFKGCHQLYQGEGPTGMLFVYPEHVVHMVECCWELIEAIVRDALNQEESSRLCVYDTISTVV